MTRARIWQEDGLTAFVTGTQNTTEATAAVRAELEARFADGDIYDVRIDDMGLEPDRLVDAMVQKLDWRLEAGRVVPDPEYGWFWWSGLRLDRPGAFFALLCDVSTRVDVPGFECKHDFTDGYPGTRSRRCVWCMEPEPVVSGSTETAENPIH